MTELTPYERRLERAFARYVDGLPVEVDAVALTDEIAAAEARSGIAGRLRAVGLAWSPGMRRAAAVLILAGLLAITTIGLALVGGRLHREPLPPQRGLVPTGIQVLEPGGRAYETTVVDGEGIVWAGGAGHVLRLDPRTGGVRTWTVENDAAFAAAILAAASRRGGAWLVDGATIRRLDGDGFSETIGAPFVAADLVEAPDGSLWAVAGGEEPGVHRWDGSAWTAIAGWDERIEPAVLAMDQDGHPWVGAWTYPGPAGAGLWHHDGRSWAVVDPGVLPARSGAIPPLAGVVLAITAAPDGSLWVITERDGGTEASHRSLLHFDGSAWTEVGSETLGFAPATVSVSADGAAWTTGDRLDDPAVRVARFDGRTWRAIAPPEDGPTLNATGILATVASWRGEAFLGTGQGLYRLRDDRWARAWPLQEGPGEVSALLALSGDEAWVTDWDRRTWRFDGARWVAGPPGLPAEAIVWDLAKAPDGRLWAATEQGVAVLDGDRWTVVDGRWSRGLAFAADGTNWVGGHADEGGIRTIRADGDRWVVASVTAEGLPKTVVLHLAIGRDGTAWADSGDWANAPGLARFDGVEWQAVEPGPRATIFGVELVIVVAADGDVWAQLGGETGAVARFDGADWRVFRAADGLPGDPGWLELGPDGQPWVSGTEGLARFDGERWISVHEGPGLAWPARFSVAPDGTAWVAGSSMVGRIETKEP